MLVTLPVTFFAPDLRGEGTSACNRQPAVPVETFHPQAILIIAQLIPIGQVLGMRVLNNGFGLDPVG